MFKIEKMNQQAAQEIADNWKYPGEYSFYDMTEDIEDYEEIVSSEKRADNYFEVEKDGQLFGFFCIQPMEDRLDEVEIGLGIKPEFTGQGMGPAFVEEIIRYIKQNTTAHTVWLDVVTFNERAIKAYKKVGFQPIKEVKQCSNGGEYTFLLMRKDI